MSSFTYIIRSNNRIDKNENTAECHLKLKGLPQQFKYFECEVVQFYVNIINLNEIIELRADSAFGFINSIDTNNGFKTCAFTSFINSNTQGPFRYIVENFNNKYVNFQLYDDSNNIVTNNDSTSFNLPWILVLNMKGIEN
jgi:hypothetical protein